MILASFSVSFSLRPPLTNPLFGVLFKNIVKSAFLWQTFEKKRRRKSFAKPTPDYEIAELLTS